MVVARFRLACRVALTPRSRIAIRLDRIVECAW